MSREISGVGIAMSHRPPGTASAATVPIKVVIFIRTVGSLADANGKPDRIKSHARGCIQRVRALMPPPHRRLPTGRTPPPPHAYTRAPWSCHESGLRAGHCVNAQLRPPTGGPDVPLSACVLASSPPFPSLWRMYPTALVRRAPPTQKEQKSASAPLPQRTSWYSSCCHTFHHC